LHQVLNIHDLLGRVIGEIVEVAGDLACTVGGDILLGEGLSVKHIGVGVGSSEYAGNWALNVDPVVVHHHSKNAVNL